MDILVSNLFKKYDTKWIIKDFSYNFDSGKSYGISGANGSGKSTLLSLLFGAIPPTKGQIEYLKNNLKLQASDLSTSFTFAAPYMSLYEFLTLSELLEFHTKFKKWIDGIDTNSFVEYCYLKEFLNVQICNYSSGMKQRLKLALAVLSDSEIIFLDEPSSYLDNKAKTWLYKMLEELKLNRTLIIASNEESDFKIIDFRIEI